MVEEVMGDGRGDGGWVMLEVDGSELDDERCKRGRGKKRSRAKQDRTGSVSLIETPNPPPLRVAKLTLGRHDETMVSKRSGKRRILLCLIYRGTEREKDNAEEG
jgi:hypothetical protein